MFSVGQIGMLSLSATLLTVLSGCPQRAKEGELQPTSAVPLNVEIARDSPKHGDHDGHVVELHGLALLQISGAGRTFRPTQGALGRKYQRSEFSVLQTYVEPTYWSLESAMHLYPDPGDITDQQVYVFTGGDGRNWEPADDEGRQRLSEAIFNGGVRGEDVLSEENEPQNKGSTDE